MEPAAGEAPRHRVTRSRSRSKRMGRQDAGAGPKSEGAGKDSRTELESGEVEDEGGSGVDSGQTGNGAESELGETYEPPGEATGGGAPLVITPGVGRTLPRPKR